MEYWIAQARTVDQLIKIVNDAIAEGWQLQGGIAATMYESYTNYYQAMVRD